MKTVGYLVLASVIFFVAPVYAQEDSSAKESKEKSGFLSDLNFEEGTFLGNVNVKFETLVNKVEDWRLAKKEIIKESLEKIDTKREDAKEPKSLEKVITVAHIAGLAVSLFVFSLQYVFWTALILMLIVLIRKIIGLIIRVFRRDHIRA